MADQVIGSAVATSRPGIGLRLDGWGTAVVVAVAWLLLITVSALNRADFLSHQTVLAITFTMSIVGVLAVGQALVSISGGFLDLSQPTSLILTALVCSRFLELDINIVLVIAITIAVGGAWGLINALIIVHGKINPVIVTLATNFIGLAVLFLVFQIAEVPINSGLRDFGRGSSLGLPNIWWPMVALILIVGFFLPRTRYGRHVIAVGGNRIAAQARGISLRRTRFAIFIAAGACAGVAGVLFAASSGPFTPASGSVFLLPVIAAIILAGVSLGGGRGNIWLILLSVGFLSTVPTALVFFGLSSDWQAIFQGFILIVAVAIDGFRYKRGAR
ncbi:MAG: ABC transporter permease [Hyphomicrobiales bacterium]|nr:ABC transporter permease [Hyphomicrobiales bacterium]